MPNLTHLYGRVLILLTFVGLSCVDRLDFEPVRAVGFPIVLSGFISNHPGPYQVIVRRAFDIDSRNTVRVPESVKSMHVFDNLGNSAEFKEVNKGDYRTDSAGIVGVVGRIYHLRVELLTGEVFESEPDTLYAPGKVDNLYYVFKEKSGATAGPTEYQFDVLYDATSSAKQTMWRFTATYKLNTVAEMDRNQEPCTSLIDCSGCHFCNLVWKCSGLRNVGDVVNPRFIRVGPCTCCTCWYNFYNERPILSLRTSAQTKFTNRTAGVIPVSKYTFQQKVYVEMQQQTISLNAYTFYGLIYDQKDAVASLFQPATARITGNFHEVTETGSQLVGVFYAAGVDKKSLFIERDDIPASIQLSVLDPEYPPPVVPRNCLYFLPEATNIRPTYWVE